MKQDQPHTAITVEQFKELKDEVKNSRNDITRGLCLIFMVVSFIGFMLYDHTHQQ